MSTDIKTCMRKMQKKIIVLVAGTHKALGGIKFNTIDILQQTYQGGSYSLYSAMPFTFTNTKYFDKQKKKKDFQQKTQDELNFNLKLFLLQWLPP